VKGFQKQEVAVKQHSRKPNKEFNKEKVKGRLQSPCGDLN
jgi:hypothetical protein